MFFDLPVFKRSREGGQSIYEGVQYNSVCVCVCVFFLGGGGWKGVKGNFMGDSHARSLI